MNVLWKIYFWLIAIQLIGIPGYMIVAASTSVGLQSTVAIHFIAGVFGVLALYGFVYRRAILHKGLWALFAVLYVFWDIFFQTGALREDGSFMLSRFALSPATLIALLFYLPQYVALLIYGFGSNNLWKPQSNNQSITPDGAKPRS